ncbi:MAG: response regulator [Actinomycetales bacterium]|nr:response regulator [Actinomycetales bacterium]
MRVLIVEDTPRDAQRHEKALKSFLPDLDVSIVETWATARKAIQGEQWDLVVCDLRIPGGSGMDIARLARAESFPTLVVSSLPELAKSLLKPKERGVLPILAKGLNMEDRLKVAAQQLFGSPAVA